MWPINNQLKNSEAKLKKYEEEYIKTQHEYYIDKIKEFKQQLYNVWNNKKYLKKGDIMQIPMITFEEDLETYQYLYVCCHWH